MGSGKGVKAGCDPGANDSGSVVRIRVQRSMSQCRGTVANKNTRIQTIIRIRVDRSTSLGWN